MAGVSRIYRSTAILHPVQSHPVLGIGRPRGAESLEKIEETPPEKRKSVSKSKATKKASKTVKPTAKDSAASSQIQVSKPKGNRKSRHQRAQENSWIPLCMRAFGTSSSSFALAALDISNVAFVLSQRHVAIRVGFERVNLSEADKLDAFHLWKRVYINSEWTVAIVLKDGESFILPETVVQVRERLSALEEAKLPEIAIVDSLSTFVQSRHYKEFDPKTKPSSHIPEQKG